MNPLDSFTVERLEDLKKSLSVIGAITLGADEGIALLEIALAAKQAVSGSGRELFKKISNRPADEDGDIYYCVSSNEMLLLETILCAAPKSE